MKTTQPLRKKKHVRKLAEYFLIKGQTRNHVLVVMGCHTALRISDLLRLTWGDVYDFRLNKISNSITISEKKTGKSKIIALHKNIVKALEKLATDNIQQDKFIFENVRTQRAISRVHAYRIIHDASEALGFEVSISCHSLRKSFGYRAFKSGMPLAVIMTIYNHSSIAVTMRYLGITQDEINKVYLNIEMM